VDDWSAIGDGIRAAFDRVADTRSLAREIRRTSEEIRERNSQLRQDLQTFETAMIRASRGIILRCFGLCCRAVAAEVRTTKFTRRRGSCEGAMGRGYANRGGLSRDTNSAPPPKRMTGRLPLVDETREAAPPAPWGMGMGGRGRRGGVQD